MLMLITLLSINADPDRFEAVSDSDEKEEKR